MESLMVLCVTLTSPRVVVCDVCNKLALPFRAHFHIPQRGGVGWKLPVGVAPTAPTTMSTMQVCTVWEPVCGGSQFRREGWQ
jgi:hypothetical protein